MSCFCRATFSSKTILSCSFSLPCVWVKKITLHYSKLIMIYEAGQCVLVLNPHTTALRASSSWPERLRTSVWCSSSRAAAWNLSASASRLNVLTSASRQEISFSIIERIWTAWAGAKYRNDEKTFIISGSCNQIPHSPKVNSNSHRKLLLWCSDLSPVQCLSTRLRSISRGFL